MRRLAMLTGCILLFTALAAAADPTGKWKGEFTAEGNDVNLTFNLTANGDTLTGTINGLPTDPVEIKEGKIQGDDVSFSVVIQYHGGPLKLIYKGKVKEDAINFTIGIEDGSWSTDFVAKRSS